MFFFILKILEIKRKDNKLYCLAKGESILLPCG